MKNRKNYPKDWERIRFTILQRDMFKCQLCGIAEKNLFSRKGKKLSLHIMHLDGNTFNNSPLNLLSGCPSCHCRHDIANGLRKEKPTYKKYQIVNFL
jgi:5-methylcytosine-specific restriction endonuclease McrA